MLCREWACLRLQEVISKQTRKGHGSQRVCALIEDTEKEQLNDYIQLSQEDVISRELINQDKAITLRNRVFSVD